MAEGVKGGLQHHSTASDCTEALVLAYSMDIAAILKAPEEKKIQVHLSTIPSKRATLPLSPALSDSRLASTSSSVIDAESFSGNRQDGTSGCEQLSTSPTAPCIARRSHRKSSELPPITDIAVTARLFISGGCHGDSNSAPVLGALLLELDGLRRSAHFALFHGNNLLVPSLSTAASLTEESPRICTGQLVSSRRFGHLNEVSALRSRC